VHDFRLPSERLPDHSQYTFKIFHNLDGFMARQCFRQQSEPSQAVGRTIFSPGKAFPMQRENGNVVSARGKRLCLPQNTAIVRKVVEDEN
jgi:hypothetical protein